MFAWSTFARERMHARGRRGVGGESTPFFDGSSSFSNNTHIHVLRILKCHLTPLRKRKKERQGVHTCAHACMQTRWTYTAVISTSALGRWFSAYELMIQNETSYSWKWKVRCQWPLLFSFSFYFIMLDSSGAASQDTLSKKKQTL